MTRSPELFSTVPPAAWTRSCRGEGQARGGGGSRHACQRSCAALAHTKTISELSHHTHAWIQSAYGWVMHGHACMLAQGVHGKAAAQHGQCCTAAAAWSNAACMQGAAAAIGPLTVSSSRVALCSCVKLSTRPPCPSTTPRESPTQARCSC